MKLSNQTILKGVQPPSIQLLLDARIHVFASRKISNPEEFVAWICRFLGTIWYEVFGVHLDHPACFAKCEQALKYSGGFDRHLSNLLTGAHTFKHHTLKTVSQFIQQEHANQHIAKFIYDLHEGYWMKKCEIASKLIKHYPHSSPIGAAQPEAMADEIDRMLHQLSKAIGIIGKNS